MKNKVRKFNLSNSILGCILLFMGVSANASLITFNDREAFLDYVGLVNTDQLDGVKFGNQPSGQRDGYQWSMDHYGCVNSQGCDENGPNAFVYGDNDWVWTYTKGAFNFDFQLTAFGIDYIEPYHGSTGQVVLNGYDSGINPPGSFFGIASTDGSTFNRISYDMVTIYGGFDNVTYSSTPNDWGNVDIAEPYGLFLLGLALVGFIRKKIRLS